MDNQDDDTRSRALASKVDALVGRHQPVADERNIPVLTDLVDAPAWSPESASPASSAAASATAAGGAGVLDQMHDDDIEQLSQEIFTRVAQRLDAEIATALEARISEHLAAQVNAAVTHVISDMKLSIANEIGDAVNAALADRLRRGK